MPRGHVLIMAEDMDPSADLVVNSLTERHVPVLRFDLADFPQSVTLAAEHGGKRSGWSGEIFRDDRAAILEEVRAVYYRRPGLPRIHGSVDNAYRVWAQSQAIVGMVQVLSSLPVVWMHHPDVYRASAHKPGQLAVATQAGLRVPRSLVTNSLARAREWGARVGGDLVCKPIASASLDMSSGEPMMIPARRVAVGALDDSLALTAHYLQEWIPKAHEVRLTVVGERMFPVAIHAGSEAARVDWRTDYDALEYESVAIPDDVARGVRAFMARYGLNYGALDFAVTPDGDWVFFECNPAGQWQFIAAATKLPIAEAHAELLEGVML